MNSPISKETGDRITDEKDNQSLFLYVQSDVVRKTKSLGAVKRVLERSWSQKE